MIDEMDLEDRLMSKINYGVSSLTWVNRPLHEAVIKAGNLHFKSIDLGMLNGWSEFGPADLVRDMDVNLKPVEEALAKMDVAVASINAGFGPETDQRKIIEQATALCTAAKRLNAVAGVTLAAPSIKSTFDEMTAYIQPIYDIFTESGVNLMFETHYGQWTEKVDNTLVMLDVFPLVQLTLDASHYIIQGCKPDDWAALIPYTGHCHIRPCGENGWGEVQVEPDKSTEIVFEWLRTMVNTSYKGQYSLEIIENFSPIDAEKAALQMREMLTKKI